MRYKSFTWRTSSGDRQVAKLRCVWVQALLSPVLFLPEVKPFLMLQKDLLYGAECRDTKCSHTAKGYGHKIISGSYHFIRTLGRHPYEYIVAQQPVLPLVALFKSVWQVP